MKPNHQLKTGLSFGLTSAVITTLGMIVGIYSVSPTKLIVIGAILSIAIADAFSDAMGIHVSEESENVHTSKEVWMSTLFTFLAKFLFAMSFVIPLLLFEVQKAIIICIVWGLSLISFYSYTIGKNTKGKLHAVVEHLSIAILVIIATHYVGTIINLIFN